MNENERPLEYVPGAPVSYFGSHNCQVAEQYLNALGSNRFFFGNIDSFITSKTPCMNS